MKKLSAISDQQPAERSHRRMSQCVFNPPPSTLHPPRRSATTLTEVLMSLMLMGIGVVTLASLFPIAILRSVQATQQTHATILAYNARSLVELYPGLLVPPSPNAQYYVVDPLGSNIIVPAALQSTFGNDGATPTPNDVPLLPPAAPAPTTFMPRVNAGFGSEAAAANLVTLPDSWVFQVDRTFSPVLPPPLTNVTFPIAAVSDLPNGLGLDGAYGVATVDDDGNGTPDDISELGWPGSDDDVRVIVFDVSGKFSETRPAEVDTTTGTVTWANPVTAFPNGLDVGSVRIESREQRYTWMLTVKRMPIDPIYNVVVFFRRSFSPEDETVHEADFNLWDRGPDGGYGVGGVDDDNDGTTDELDEGGPGIWVGPDGQPGVAGVDDDSNGTLDDNSELGWPGSDDVRSDDRRNRIVENVDRTLQPFIKKGGYVLDARNLEWYRIQDMQDIGGGLVNLVVDRDIVRESHPTATHGNAIFMRGIVQVY